MTWRDTVRTGGDAIRHHRLRSALTMLGILIGIAAVMLTVGIGQGAQDEVDRQIAALGTDLLIVLVAHRYGWTPSKQRTRVKKNITWMECDTARSANVEVLPFIIDEDHVVDVVAGSFDLRLQRGIRLNLAAEAGEIGRLLADLGVELSRVPTLQFVDHNKLHGGGGGEAAEINAGAGADIGEEAVHRQIDAAGGGRIGAGRGRRRGRVELAVFRQHRGGHARQEGRGEAKLNETMHRISPFCWCPQPVE